MSNVVISPSMNLPVPVVSVEIGPAWATDINACMSAIDSHTHAPGQGVQISPNGININADLPMNNYNLTTARSVRLQAQGSPLALATDLGCIYVSGVDLYYNDENGNQVRITQSGGVTGATGTITGLPSGTASASYAAGTFTFQSATSTPAAMALGPTKVAQQVASGFGVTLTAAVAQASDYALTFPAALPSTTSFLTEDTSGNLANVAYASGTYLPSYTNTPAGISFSNTNPFTYVRVGSIVTVCGNVGMQFISNANAAITFNISTPVASAIGVTAGGGTFTPPNETYVLPGAVTNSGNSLVVVASKTTGSVGATISCGISFMYILA